MIIIFLGMSSLYLLQLPIIHAKLMVVGFWITLYTIYVWGLGVITLKRGERLSDHYLSYTIPLNYLFLPYMVFMLKGVSIYIQKNMCLMIIYIY